MHYYNCLCKIIFLLYCTYFLYGNLKNFITIGLAIWKVHFLVLFLIILSINFGKCHHAFIIKNRLYCTVRGGLVAAYLLLDSQRITVLPWTEIKINVYTTVISQLLQ